MEKYVVTINRMCGCGGVQVGESLSRKLHISMYDKKLLRMASDDSGIDENLFARADEKLRATPLFRITRKVYSGELIRPQSGDFTSDHNLFNYQAKVLRELANQESCIVIGRCADYILKNHPRIVRVFITADEETCAVRETERYGISMKEAYEKCERKNKERANYYKYYTDQTWCHAGNYDLCLNSSHLSYDECADMIVDYMEKRFGEKFV